MTREETNMRKTILRTTLAALAIGTGLSTAVMAQELRMTIWSANEAHLALFNEIGDEFEASHPGVTVTYDSLAFEGYVTTLTTQIAGGNPPDLAWLFDSTAPDFMAAGALYPLTETFANTEGYDIADFPPATLTAWSSDGVQYAYPFSTSPFGVFVNNDMIRAAGAETPAEMIAAGEWTWDNAIATAAAVAATGKQGLIVRDFEYKAWENLAEIWTGWGASPWSEDTKTCTFTTPEMVEAMSFIHDAVFVKKALPGPGISADFFAGDAAMTTTQISRASLLPKDDAFEWDLVPLPTGPVGEYAFTGRAGIGVLANGKNPELAAEFLAFFSSKPNVAKLARFFPPARQSLLTADVLAAANPLLSREQIEAVVIRGVATGQSTPPVRNFAQLQQTVRAGLDGLWQPDADVAAVMQTICDRINPLLAAN
jgi:multiple sugar transport system substrate-binding protein